MIAYESTIRRRNGHSTEISFTNDRFTIPVTLDFVPYEDLNNLRVNCRHKKRIRCNELCRKYHQDHHQLRKNIREL